MQNAAVLIIEDWGPYSKSLVVSLLDVTIISSDTVFLHALSYFLKATKTKTPIHFMLDIIDSSITVNILMIFLKIINITLPLYLLISRVFF